MLALRNSFIKSPETTATCNGISRDDENALFSLWNGDSIEWDDICWQKCTTHLPEELVWSLFPLTQVACEQCLPLVTVSWLTCIPGGLPEIAKYYPNFIVAFSCDIILDCAAKTAHWSHKMSYYSAFLPCQNIMWIRNDGFINQLFRVSSPFCVQNSFVGRLHVTAWLRLLVATALRLYQWRRSGTWLSSCRVRRRIQKYDVHNVRNGKWWAQSFSTMLSAPHETSDNVTQYNHFGRNSARSQSSIG